MTDWVNLLHATNEDVETLMEEGLRTKVSQGKVGNLVSDTVRNNVVYFFDSDDVHDFIAEEYVSRDFVECRLPKDNIYVASWGGYEEKLSINELENVAVTYEEFERGEKDFGDNSLMCLHPGDVPPGQIVSYKWR